VSWVIAARLDDAREGRFAAATTGASAARHRLFAEAEPVKPVEVVSSAESPSAPIAQSLMTTPASARPRRKPPRCG